jgi:hypothetical protein
MALVWIIRVKSREAAGEGALQSVQMKGLPGYV